MILLIALIAHRLFRNPLLTGLASALMAVDGMALVHSRTALLDNFLALFILAATYLFLRRQYWWTAIALGLALGTKWSAVYFIAIFGLIAPPSFPIGGMENPRLTFATPTIIAGDKSLVSLIAHEMAHSWRANCATRSKVGRISDLPV